MDLKYIGMENFGSRPSEPREVAFDEISKCQILIGIYAHRYGTIIEGDDLSITEQEFDFARARRIKTYCYIVDSKHPWSPDLVQKEYTEKLDKFLNKVKILTVSFFNTPEDLGSKIAIDLGWARKYLEPQESYNKIRSKIQRFAKSEINVTIGPKYLRDLYIQRSSSKAFREKFRSLTKIPNRIKAIRIDCEELHEFLQNLGLKSMPITSSASIRGMRKTLMSCINRLKKYENQQSNETGLNPPALDLNLILSNLKEEVLKDRPTLQRKFASAERESWYSLRDQTKGKVELLTKALRPVYLIIDRAGSGKTNLLCGLTEDFGQNYICFFLSSKSVLNASDLGIVNYLSKSHPIGNDPVDIALSVAEKEDKLVIIIIDGINENLYPREFNLAIRLLVNRYSDRPIRYIISCRDIYWSFFESEWWPSQCAFTFRNKLYNFNSREFNKAMPLYFEAYHIVAAPAQKAREQLRHPLLLRFFCEAFQGSPNNKRNLGRVEDIRLLDLFDSYCELKFDQIRERLQLSSPDEIVRYIEMLAMLMLERRARLLPLSVVADEAYKKFAESSLRQEDSRYNRILDEDILIEEQPSGSKMDLLDLKVGFVYDEFMEYVIAKAIWSSHSSEGNRMDSKIIISTANGLLPMEEQFISCQGIVLYLGELLAKRSGREGLKYLDWLISIDREDLACRLVVRWPITKTTEQIFERLIKIHRLGKTNLIKKAAWKAMENVCLYLWDIFFSYINKMPLTGSFKPINVFATLRRVEGGPDPLKRFATIKWISKVLKEQEYLIAFEDSLDFQSGVNLINDLIKNGGDQWNYNQIRSLKGIQKSVRGIVPKSM